MKSRPVAPILLVLMLTQGSGVDAASPCGDRDALEALTDPSAAFLVLRHEKKGPDERADLSDPVRACQKRWRGKRFRDQRVVLQDGGLADAIATGADLPAAALQPAIFHSRYCRSLETALGIRDGSGQAVDLLEIDALDLGTGDLRRALETAAEQVLQRSGDDGFPVVLVTHKDRFSELGLEPPLQGGGYVVDRSGACLAHLPARE